MSNEPSNKEQAVFIPPVSAFAGPIAELVGHRQLSPPSRPGPLAALGNYEVIRVLGSGGMGIVLLARDGATGRNVAVKMVRPELVSNQQIVHRFVREAGHLQKLKHKNVVQVLEVSDRAEGPYFVMPYSERGSLAQRIKPGEPLERAATLEIALQVARGLQFAHRRGIIHRDLKPANILLGSDGEACLADFGLARTMFNDTIVDVEREQLEGTAPYMSPGVAAGNAEDTRCDIYAFGALLYEMLTGEPPYAGKTTKEIREQILKGPPRAIKARNAVADSNVASVAEGAMARELRNRYADMTDVVVDLERIQQGRGPLGPHGLGRRVRKIPAGIWVAVGFLALAVGSWLVWPTPQAPITKPAPQPVVVQNPPATVKQAPAPQTLPQAPQPISGWVMPVIAGKVGEIGSADGAGVDARFRSPSGIAVDSVGNLYVADMGNNTIRKIAPDHTVTTIAGLAGSPGAQDGPGDGARFMAPHGIAVDGLNNVYVAEFANNTVRKIGPDGTVGLLAGARTPGSANGQGKFAQFRNPWALATDRDNNIYVSDNGNRSLRKITPDGVVITLSDSFGDPRGVALDGKGNIYVADLGNNSIRKITPSSKATTLTVPLSAPESLAVDGLGFVYVTDDDGIHKISPGGKTVLLPPVPLMDSSTGPMLRAVAIAVDAGGNIYLADSDHSVICRYPSPGSAH